MPEMLKVAGVQMDVAFKDPATNLARMLEALEETSASGARLTVFPECSLTGYCFESLEEARPFTEPVPGPATERVAEACRRLGTHAVFGMLEEDSERVFNVCVMVGPEGVAGTYRKIHLPYLGVDMFTTPGDRAFAVSEAGGVRVGMNICYDGAFPEAARIMALEGAELIVLPTNWPPGAETTADYAINARAMENAVYYMAVNRIGSERDFPFIGKSKICDTNGNTIAVADHRREEILYAELDLERARTKHRVRVPGKHEIDRFADRRPEMYGLITAPRRPAD